MFFRYVRILAMICYSLFGIKRNYDKIDIIVLSVIVIFFNNVIYLIYIYIDRFDILIELVVIFISIDIFDNYLY